MSEGDEVAVLAEAIDDGEEHRLPVNTGQRFDEVEPDIRPDDCGDGQRHEEPCRVEVLRLVPLTSDAHSYKVLNKTTHVWKMKVTSKALQSTLDALMAVVVDRRDDLLQERGGQWYVEAPIVEHHAIRHGLGGRA